MIHYISVYGVGDAWVGNELRIMKNAGIQFKLNALRKPTKTYFASPLVAQFEKETKYLYPINKIAFLKAVLSAPVRFGTTNYLSALWSVLTADHEPIGRKLKIFFHFLVACYFADQIKDENCSHIHSQWIHSAGTVGMYAAWLLGKSFSFTGHAADLFRERIALKEKIRRAAFIICISEFHRRFYLENGASPGQLKIAYCGIDVRHFSPKSSENKSTTPMILASGRLVEKKGFAYLIGACKILEDQGHDFNCIIGGSGPLEDELKRQIEANNLKHRVHVTGEAILQEKIPEFMHRGDLYCLPCVWATDNDVDGLPQMLMEAMACGVPVISTRLVGIPDLVIDGMTGLLVAPNDSKMLAEAILRLISDKVLSKRLAENGRKYVIKKFNLDSCLNPLIFEFRKRS